MTSVERTGGGRILRGTAGMLEVTVCVDGTATDPTVASVAVADEAGNSVSVGPASIAGSNSGRVTASLASTSQVANLEATWTLTVGGISQSFTTNHRIIGDWLFTEADARAFDGNAMASATTYPDALLRAARDRITESFEDVTRVPWGLSYSREIRDGTGNTELWLWGNRVESLRSVSYRLRGQSAWTAFTAAELADVMVEPNGRLTRETLGAFYYGKRNIAIEYEHGWQPIPEEVKRAALWLLKDQLCGSDLPRNAISQSDQLGTFTLSVPGLRGSYYGLPQVDEVVKRYTLRIPGVG